MIRFETQHGLDPEARQLRALEALEALEEMAVAMPADAKIDWSRFASLLSVSVDAVRDALPLADGLTPVNDGAEVLRLPH